MNPLVFVSLAPVGLLIAAGFLACRVGWIRAVAIKHLSNLVFLLLQGFNRRAAVLVGATLANTPVARHWRQALALAGVKNLLHPLLMLGLCLMLDISGLPMTVMVVAAALPIGAMCSFFCSVTGR
jgi:hypothetical protein